MMPARSQLELQAMARTAARTKRTHAKPRKRATRPAVVAPSFVPWRCVVLAIDPGNESGWAIYVCGVLVQFGTLDVFDHETVAKVIAAALRMAEFAGADAGDVDPVPTLMAIERAFSPGARRGAARPLWQSAWAKARCVEKRIVRPHASRWRSQLFGRGAGAWPQARARAEEQTRARGIAKRGDMPIQHDAAAAICIGAWGCRAAEVGSKLPVKFRYREVG